MVETSRTIAYNDERVIDRYTEKRPLYEKFVLHLADLVRGLMDKAGIEVHAVEHRAKSVESFRDKIRRPGKHYGNPLQDVSDLVGVRVILYYEEDVRKVCNLLKREFIIVKSQSADKAKMRTEDRFGYLSDDYVAKLSKSRQRLSEWAKYKELKVEIQVRTVLQHAWAAYSHKLYYKQESLFSEQYRRRLVRLAGLLELADEEFGDLKKQALTRSRRAKRQLSQGRYGLKVNLTSVTEYVRTSEVVARIAKMFKKFGFQINDHFDNAEQLTLVAVRLQLNTIAKLNSALKKSVAELDSFLPAFIHEKFGEGKSQWSISPVAGDPDHWATVALLQSVAKDLSTQELRRLVSWGEEYLNAVISARHT